MTVTLHVCRDTAAVLAATPAAAPAAAPAVAPAAARSKDAGVMAETSRTRVSLLRGTEGAPADSFKLEARELTNHLYV